MKLVCIVNAHAPYKGELMESSAKRVGIDLVKYAEGEEWPRNYRVGKIEQAIEAVRALPEDVTHVMFTDNADTLFLAGADEIVQKFELMRDDSTLVVIAGEKNCYPDAGITRDYPAAKTLWHFVNSGGWIARREDAVYALSLANARGFECDQRCWSYAYVFDGSRPIKVDENCLIFQSMFHQLPAEFRLNDERMENTITGSRPCLLHWNGTRNEGSPYSRDGVWKEIDPAYIPQGKRPTIAVCRPGNNFSSDWVAGWEDLYVEMLKYFGSMYKARGWGNNIYQVRENCLRECVSYAPEYVLWLDSDNPPTVEGFAHLWAAIQGNPVVSAVGAWYRFWDPAGNRVLIAAGQFGGPDPDANITEEEIRKAEHLIQVPFIGFGMCLMKWKMIEDIGVLQCFEPYRFPYPNPKTGRTWATDDCGFFARAREAGHKIFLHPAVFLEHEKCMNVPASFEQRNEISTLKEA